MILRGFFQVEEFLVHEFDIFVADKIMLPETAAEGLGNVHQLMDNHLILLFWGQRAESFEKFNGILGLHSKGFLHELANRVAARERALCAAAFAAEAFYSFNVNVFHTKSLHYLSHVLL